MPGHGQVSEPKGEGDGPDPTPAGGDGPAGDAPSESSGYRRDDYWRKAQQGLPADAEPEPAHGQDFEPVEERAGADREAPAGDDDPSGAGDDSARSDETPAHVPPHAR